jgi:hypothetical protein
MTKKLLALYGLKWNPFAPDVPVDVGLICLPIGNSVFRAASAYTENPHGNCRSELP